MKTATQHYVRCVAAGSVVFLLIYLMIVVIGYCNVTSFIYEPGHDDFFSCTKLGLHIQRTNFHGTRMYYHSSGDRIAVYYHGSNLAACDRDHYDALFQGLGVSYLLVEYCGYAGDKRSPSRSCILDDVKNVIAFLQAHYYDSEHVMLVGHIVWGPDTWGPTCTIATLSQGASYSFRRLHGSVRWGMRTSPCFRWGGSYRKPTRSWTISVH